MDSADAIVREIELQWADLLRVRAFFPTMLADAIGARDFFTAPFYHQHGHRVRLSFEEPLTHEMIAEHNQVGSWLNESYVIRLCALLEFHEAIPREGKGRIDQSIEGHDAIDVLRRLRNELVHRSGKHNPDDSECRRLYDRMLAAFAVQAEPSATATRYPVHINTFLMPVTEACKAYVRAWCGSSRSARDRAGPV